MTKIEQKVYTYILYNSPLKLNYETLSKALDMTKSHLYKIVSQLFSKESITKTFDEKGETILIANSVKTIDNNWKDQYTQLLENIILKNDLKYGDEILTNDKLKEIQKEIYQAYKK